MSDNERKTILVISDHPLIPSGVGIQTKYLIEGLLKTGKYRFFCFGGALKHPNMDVQMVEPDTFGHGNWVIKPVIGHGDKNLLRRALQEIKPDGVLFVTDPRFFTWLWEMEDEVRSVCPLMYWHVWDNDPSPDFNKIFYDSTDAIGCISLKTYGLLQDLGHRSFEYIPHALPDQLFKPLSEDEVREFRKTFYGHHADRKFIVMWNNRNARRKQTGDVVATFAKFAEKVGKDRVSLLMHTAIGDQEGQDILALADKFGITKSVMISEKRVQPEVINKMYNTADVTINIASNEGFGLSTLESLYAGTPIIVHMTGGLQFQIGPWHEPVKDFSDQDRLRRAAEESYRSGRTPFFGVPVFPASRSCTGSQTVPYIYDDKTNHDDVVKALLKLYEMGREKREEIGLKGREWALKHFDLGEMVSKWDSLIEKTINEFEPVTARSAVV